MLIRRAAPKIILLASSAVAVSHTGDTNETILATVPIPAGLMGLNGALRISSGWSIPGGSGNTKTTRVRFGGISGTVLLSVGHTTNVSMRDSRIWQNAGSASSQIGDPSNSATPGSSTAAFVTGAVDTAVAQDLVFTAQSNNAGETITLLRWMVELILP